MKNSGQKVLVVGADGLLGSHLVRKLIAQDYKVRVFVQPQSNSPTLDGLPVERLEGDLLSENGKLAAAMRDCRFVFHLAAITDLWASPELVWKVNLDGTRKVIDACLENGVQRLVFTGSASSYSFGSQDSPGDENGPFPGQYQGIAYMESKYQAVKLVQSAVTKRGLDAVIVAPTFLLGAYDWRPSSGELIRQFIRRRMRFTSPGGRNFAYAPDVAGAMLAALHKGKKGQAYIAGGHNCSYLDFFSRVARIAGGLPAPSIVLPQAAILASGVVGSLYGKILSKQPRLNMTTAKLSLYGTYYSSDKAVRELGMEQTSLEQAIEESIASLREYKYID
jgi:dihydroflavonol-4-reductase